MEENRGVINELAFRLYAESNKRDVRVSDLGQEVVEGSISAALEFIRRFREYSREPVPRPSSEAVSEARSLAVRLELFVDAAQVDTVEVSPKFVGCGWLDECNGDLLMDDLLCEVKAGGSLFRGRDFRQILTYAALNSQSRQYSLDAVCLVNPRLGVYLRESLDTLCFALAGGSPSEVLGEIVNFLSQPHWRDEAV